MELGKRLRSIISSNDSFFEKCNKARKKVNIDGHVEVIPNKMLPAQSKKDTRMNRSTQHASMNRSIQHATALEHNDKYLSKAQ